MSSFIFFFYFYFLIYLLTFIDPLYLNSGVTMSSCYHLHMPLLYGILTVTNRLQPPHLSFFFLYKFSIVLSPQIDRYGLQWDNLFSVFPILSIMTQVCLPKPNQISTRDREWL